MKVDIYIKTISHGNPKGEGKAAATLEFVKRDGTRVIRTVTTETADDTKNRLELCIINKALTLLIRPCEVTIHTSNRMVRHAMEQGWVRRWSQNDWVKSDGKEPAHVEEWKRLLMASELHRIKWEEYNPVYEETLEAAVIEKERGKQ